MLEQGLPAVVSHKGAPLVLASESKAHAQAQVPAKRPQKRVQKSRPPISQASSPPSPVSSLPSPAHVAISPAHSPSNRPYKRVRTEGYASTTDDTRPIKPLPHAFTGPHGDFGLKRKTPGAEPAQANHFSAQPQSRVREPGPSHFTGLAPAHLIHSTGTPIMPPYHEVKGPSIPVSTRYDQSGFAPPGFPPPMHQLPLGMYHPGAHPQMGPYWPQQMQQNQWQPPPLAPTMSPEQYRIWYASQQPK